MTPLWVVVAVSLAGGVGAVCRFVLDGMLTDRFRIDYPVGTTVINLSGSLLLGFVTGVAVTHALPPEFGLIIGAGFLGGYTTFSAASVDTVRLAQKRRWSAALANGFGMLIGALVAAGAGLWLGGLV